MNDLMIDLETLGTSNNAVIVQIGACFFDRYTGIVETGIRYNISIDSCLAYGLQVDGGALEFWLNQKNRTWLDNQKPLKDVLEHFKKYIMQQEGIINSKNITTWAHATFDFPILINAFKKTKVYFPIGYRSLRDIRTLVDLSGGYKPLEETEEATHDALDDCKRQVRYCTKAFNIIKEKRV